MTDVPAGDSIYPVAVLIDELKNDDLTIRLNSIRRLGTIASALGEERTRKELVPFITDCLNDEDEVLLALSEELAKFVPYVGGAQWAHVLLGPLEELCTMDETLVREKATSSLAEIGPQLPLDSVAEHFVPLVKRLGQGEWFTSRVSACHLIAAAYPLANTAQRTELRQIFKTLGHDETPMVRRAAALKLGDVAQNVETAHVTADLLPIFQALTRDEQDSVRLLAVTGCGVLARLLPRDSTISSIVPLIQLFSNTQRSEGPTSSPSLCDLWVVTEMDKSWRVRYKVAQQVHQLCEILGPTASRADLISAFTRLMSDVEAEVRIASVNKAAAFCRLLQQEQILKEVLPCVKELAADSSQFVRAALAGLVMELAPILGKQATIDQLLPVFLSLLKDDFPDVRLNIISKLDQVNTVIGIDLLAQSLLPAIEELAEDKHWRVRLAIINYIPLLACQLGADLFDTKLGPQCMKWLEDSVFSIRDAATKNLQKLAQEFGPEWAKDHLVGKVLGMVDNPHYLYRMTILVAIANLAPVVSHDVLCNSMLPVIVACAKDRVPNIKFNVAKLLKDLMPLVDIAEVETVIRPCLLELRADTDADVRYYAHQALDAGELTSTA